MFSVCALILYVIHSFYVIRVNLKCVIISIPEMVNYVFNKPQFFFVKAPESKAFVV